jgi:acetyl-CoA synthetase
VNWAMFLPGGDREQRCLSSGPPPIARFTKHRVTNTLLVPTMIRLMTQVPDPPARFDLKLRSLMSGGEAVGAEIIEWTRETLKVRINEVFGQTGCNSCSATTRP